MQIMVLWFFKILLHKSIIILFFRCFSLESYVGSVEGSWHKQISLPKNDTHHKEILDPYIKILRPYTVYNI